MIFAFGSVLGSLTVVVLLDGTGGREADVASLVAASGSLVCSSVLACVAMPRRSILGAHCWLSASRRDATRNAIIVGRDVVGLRGDCVGGAGARRRLEVVTSRTEIPRLGLLMSLSAPVIGCAFGPSADPLPPLLPRATGDDALFPAALSSSQTVAKGHRRDRTLCRMRTGLIFGLRPHHTGLPVHQ